MDFKFSKVGNGSQLCLINKPGKIAHFRFRFSTGAWFEDDSTRGIYHAMEHLFFNSSTKVTQAAFSKRMDELGATVNAFTSYAEVTFTCTVLRENLMEALNLYWDIVSTFSPTEEILKKELGVIYQEIDMRKDNDWSCAYEEFYAKALAQHPNKYPVIGYKDVLENITLDALKETFEKSFTSHNLTLIVVADMNSEDTDANEKILIDFLSQIPDTGVETIKEISDSQRVPVTKIVRAYKQGMTQTKLLAFNLFGNTPSSRVYAAITSRILGGSMSSFLWNEFREKRNLAYTIGSYIVDLDQQTGMIAFCASLSNEDEVDLAQELFGNALDYLNDITEENFNKGKTQCLFGIYESLEVSSDIGDLVGQRIYANRDSFDPAEYEAAYIEANYEGFLNFVKTLNKEEMLHMVYAPLK